LDMRSFGTDGIRRIADRELNEAAYKLGKALSSNGKKILLGVDTRPSGKTVAEYFYAGVKENGGEMINCGIIPTPALSFAVKKLGAYRGVEITASHNSVEYNGLKVFDENGAKISGETAEELEAVMDSVNDSPKTLPLPEENDQALNEYLKNFDEIHPCSFKILIDTACGATTRTAPKIIERRSLNASILDIDKAINDACGANDVRLLKSKVVAENYDFGLAVDGDGDRLVMVTKEGKVLKGEELIYILAVYMKKKKTLKGKVVLTEITNGGLLKSLKSAGVDSCKCKVGDANVYRKMRDIGSNLGGEPSGHILIDDMQADGLWAGIKILNVLKEYPDILNDLKLLPEASLNFRYSKELETKLIARAETWRGYLGDKGKITVRASGTEPLIRVRVECESSFLCREIIKDLRKS